MLNQLWGKNPADCFGSPTHPNVSGQQTQWAKANIPESSSPRETFARTLFALSTRINTGFSKKDHSKLAQLESTGK